MHDIFTKEYHFFISLDCFNNAHDNSPCFKDQLAFFSSRARAGAEDSKFSKNDKDDDDGYDGQNCEANYLLSSCRAGFNFIKHLTFVTIL